MKNICIVSRDLSVGGIQRSLYNLLCNIDKNKYDVDVYLYNNNNFYEKSMPNNINVIYLKPRNKVLKFIPFNIVKQFAKSKLNNKKYDYVIDFDGYQTDTALEVILSSCNNKVMWIHSDLKIRYQEEVKYRIIYFFSKGKYKYYNMFVGVSKGVIKPFEELNKMDITNKNIVIPNYIDTSIIFEKAKEECDITIDKSIYNFVSVGRICNAKGYDILLGYLNELKEVRKDFHFYLIGDGEDKNKIENLVENYSLQNYVTLLGRQSNPFKYLKLMDGFILTSRYEGQGMVILEALSLGLEIFMTKNLEKYNEGLIGYTDLLKELINAKKKDKVKNDLKEYNENITSQIDKLLK